jgi:hypothetical protein
MALKYYKNKETGEIIRSLKKQDSELFEEILIAPNQKFMVKANEGMGTSKIKDLEKTLKTRARNHSRDTDLDSNITINKINGLEEQVNSAFLNNKKERRRKIDDI